MAQSIKERFDYGQNPDKAEGGELISCYEYDYKTADTEFLLSKVKSVTGRRSASHSSLARSPQKKQTVSAMKPLCAGLRASTPFSLPPINTGIFSVPAVLCVGSLIVSA